MMRRYAIFFVMLLSMTVVLVPMTQAADGDISGRIVCHNEKVEMIEVGDLPGHIMGVLKQSGLYFASTGEIATTQFTTIINYINGAGTLTAQQVTTFQDGSNWFINSAGTAKPALGGKKTIFEGTWELTGGTARFEGVKGKGTFKGERIGDLKTGADSYFDVTGTMTKK
jgi:hypothetical protein